MGTHFELEKDGSFKGEYHDTDMGDIGEGYPQGTIYICEFEGKFTEPEKVDDYTYSMKLDDFKTGGTAGEISYKDDIRYVYSEPYGFDKAEEFFIYLPGKPLSEVPEDFLMWSFINMEIRDTLPSGYFGIYNTGGAEGFVGLLKDNIWNYYEYSYEGCKSALSPSYFGPSHLTFWPEEGAAALDLSFDWKDDEQREFLASDANGNGDYKITITFQDDLSAASVELVSLSGYDLTMWGGSTDGRLTAEYEQPYK